MANTVTDTNNDPKMKLFDEVTATKTYTAEAGGSNYHNWNLTFTITQADLDDAYGGDTERWLTAISRNEVDFDEAEDEGDGGTIEVNGEAITLQTNLN